MDWIRAHYMEVFAIVGMAYSVALAVVKLTPTPRDDAALERVAAPVRLVGKLFGLTLKQGLEAKDDAAPGASPGA